MWNINMKIDAIKLLSESLIADEFSRLLYLSDPDQQIWLFIYIKRVVTVVAAAELVKMLSQLEI